jgi:integrase
MDAYTGSFMPKITKSAVDASHWTGKQIPLWDSEIKGLGVRLTSTGAKSYVFAYRHHGRARRVTIAKTSALEPFQARRRAKELAAMVAVGRDPQAEEEAKAQAAAAERQRQRDTFERIAADFVEKHAKKSNRSWAKTEAVLARHVLPHWGARPVEGIKRRDVLRLLDDVSETRGPGAADDVRKALSRLFNWCVEREIIPASPMAGMRRPAKQASREHVLSPQELRRVWEAAGELGYPFGSFFRLLILTGQRRNEVAKLRWDRLDLAADQPVWRLEAEDTKAKRVHLLPLSPEAVAILRDLQKDRSDDGYVFTTTGDTPISGFSKAKQQLDKRSGVTGWILHDLRRTAASGLAKLNSSEAVLSRILNHAPSRSEGITGRVYNHHDYLPQMRSALEQWAAHVTGPAEPGNNVVQLRG